MKKKILLILSFCMVGLFLDDLAMRVAHMEDEARDLSFRRSRLAAVEERIKKITALEEQMRHVDERLLLINPLLAKNNLAAKRLELMEDLLQRTALADQSAKVFRTTQKPLRVASVSIGSLPAHQNTNWGGHHFLRIGSVDNSSVGRSLIKFLDFDPEFFKGKTILSAVLYIKQCWNDSVVEDDAAMNETIDLFMIKKEWGEGRNIRGAANHGDASWVSARTGVEEWSIPGAGSPDDDHDPEILATSGDVVSGDALEWVPFIFNKEGITKLLDIRNANHGFFLKMRDESKVNSAVYFHSSKASNWEDIPYMEIYYRDERSK